MWDQQCKRHCCIDKISLHYTWIISYDMTREEQTVGQWLIRRQSSMNQSTHSNDNMCGHYGLLSGDKSFTQNQTTQQWVVLTNNKWRGLINVLLMMLLMFTRYNEFIYLILHICFNIFNQLIISSINLLKLCEYIRTYILNVYLLICELGWY